MLQCSRVNFIGDLKEFFPRLQAVAGVVIVDAIGILRSVRVIFVRSVLLFAVFRERQVI